VLSAFLLHARAFGRLDDARTSSEIGCETSPLSWFRVPHIGAYLSSEISTSGSALAADETNDSAPSFPLTWVSTDGTKRHAPPYCMNSGNIGSRFELFRV